MDQNEKLNDNPNPAELDPSDKPLDADAPVGEAAASETPAPDTSETDSDAAEETPPPRMDSEERPALFTPSPSERLPRPEWNRLLEQLERELALSNDPQQDIALHFSLGEILEIQAGDPLLALAHYDQALDADPLHQPSLRARARVRKQLGRFAEAVKDLETIHTTNLAPSERIGVLVDLAQLYSGRLKLPLRAVERLEQAMEIDPRNLALLKLLESTLFILGDKNRLDQFYKRYLAEPDFASVHLVLLQSHAQILEGMEDRQRDSMEAYKKIIALEPSNLLAISALKRLLVKHQQWQQLASVYRHEESITGDPRRKALLKYLQARLTADHLKDPTQASNLLAEGLEFDLNNPLLLDELEAILESRSEWSKLAIIRERQFALATEAEKQLDIALKLGSLFDERINDPDQSAAWYEKALEIRPDYLPAIHVLGKIYGRKKDFVRLAIVLRKEIATASDPKLKASRLFSLGELGFRHLGNADLAVACFREVLELLPGYLPAIKTLSEIYAQTGRWRELVDLNEEQLDANPSFNEEQVTYLLEKNAALLEQMGELDEAIKCHQDLLRRRKDWLPSVQTLGRLFAKTRRFRDLIAINDLEAELINDQHRVVALLLKSGDICENELDDPPAAMDYYKRVLTIAPAHVPAIKALGAMYQREGRWEDLIRLYQRELEAVEDGEQTVSVRHKMALIYEEGLGQLAKAEQFYRQILESYPEFTPALHALTAMLQRQEAYPSLVEVYESQARRASHQTSRIFALYKAAEIHETKLHNVVKAEEIYALILQLDPKNVAAKRGLYRLYAQTDNLRKNLDLIRQDLDMEADPSRRLPLLMAAADLYSALPGRESEAIAIFREALNLDPANLTALSQLERLLRGQSRFDELADLYEARVDFAAEPDAKRTYLLSLIDVLENHLDDFDRLHVCYRQLLDNDPYNGRALDFFEEVYARERRWEDLLDIYDRMRQVTEDKYQLLHVYLSSGQILEMELSKPEEALKRFESALSLDPAYLPAAKAAKRIYTRLERFNDLINLLVQELEIAGSTASYLATAYQIAFLKESKFGLRRDALDYYLKVLDLDPGHKEAFLRARKILNDEKDYPRLVGLIEKRLSALELPDEKVELHRQASELCEMCLSDLARAVAHRRKVLEILPEDIAERERLADLLVKNAQWSDAVEAYNELVRHIESPEKLKDLYFRMGSVYQDHLHSLGEAAKAFEMVLSFERDDLHAMERLAMLYKDLKLPEEAGEMLDKLLANPLPKEKEIHYRLMMGDILSDQPDRADIAAAHFEKILNLDPGNSEVQATLFEIFHRNQNWTKLAELYERASQSLPADALSRKVDLLLDLARLFADRLKDTERSLDAIRRALLLDPDRTDLLAYQAALLGQNALHYLDAIDKHRLLLDREPFRVESHRELLRLFSERKESDKAFGAMMVLDFLRALPEEDSRRFRAMKEQASFSIATILSEKDQDRLLVHPKEKSLVRDILRQIEPALWRIEPPANADAQLSGTKPLNASASFYQLLESIGYLMGVDLFRLYLAPQPPNLLSTPASKPPTIIAGGGLVYAQEGIKRTLAGMVMSRYRNGHAYYMDRSPQTLSLWVEGACRLYVPDLPVRDASPEAIEDFSNKLNRNIPKTSRKELEESARLYARLDPAPRMEDYLSALCLTEFRTGFLVGGDLLAAAECKSFLSAGTPYRHPGTTSEIIERYADDPVMRDLCRYAVGEEFIELRQMLHLSVE